MHLSIRRTNCPTCFAVLTHALVDCLAVDVEDKNYIFAIEKTRDVRNKRIVSRTSDYVKKNSGLLVGYCHLATLRVQAADVQKIAFLLRVTESGN
jgi:hypothetical protein